MDASQLKPPLLEFPLYLDVKTLVRLKLVRVKLSIARGTCFCLNEIYLGYCCQWKMDSYFTILLQLTIYPLFFSVSILMLSIIIDALVLVKKCYSFYSNLIFFWFAVGQIIFAPLLLKLLLQWVTLFIFSIIILFLF